jgi:acyl carrier protein
MSLGKEISEERPAFALNEYLAMMSEMLQVQAIEPLEPQSSLYEDWGIDSLQAFELIILTEQLAGLHIPPAEIPLMFTVQDAYEYYQLCRTLRSQSQGPV